MGILKRFLRGGRKAISADEITDQDRRNVLRRLLGKCVICSGPFEQHATYRLATLLADQPDSLRRVGELIAARNWKAIEGYKEWLPDSDVREILVLRCSEGDVAIITILFTAELWTDDVVEATEKLDNQARESLSKTIDCVWEPL